jgi:beta-glucan synthesis-associated protein KRE6
MSSPLNPNKPRPPPVNVDNSRSLTGSPPDGLQTPRGNHALTRTLTPQTPTSPGFLSSAPYTDAPPSQEHLLPPSRDRFKKHYSPSVSSRRSSISSFDSNGDIRYGPYAGNDPFSDSRAPSRCGSPTNEDKYEDEVEDLNSDTIAYNKRFDVTPKDGILLYRDQPEPDDDMHDPHKDDGEKEGDCNIWTKRGVVNVGVLIVFMLALVGLLVGYPIMYVYFRP